VGGVWSTIVNVSLFVYQLKQGEALDLDPDQTLMRAMTMAFLSLVLIQFFKAYNFRSDRESVLNRPFANKWLNIAIVWELMLLCLIIYVPVLSTAFGTYTLPLTDWLIVIGAAFTIVPVLEATKWAVRRMAPVQTVTVAGGRA
jgi:Ca2+-transporting ATPase